MRIEFYFEVPGKANKAVFTVKSDTEMVVSAILGYAIMKYNETMTKQAARDFLRDLLAAGWKRTNKKVTHDEVWDFYR